MTKFLIDLLHNFARRKSRKVCSLVAKFVNREFIGKPNFVRIMNHQNSSIITKRLDLFFIASVEKYLPQISLWVNVEVVGLSAFFRIKILL